MKTELFESDDVTVLDLVYSARKHDSLSTFPRMFTVLYFFRICLFEVMATLYSTVSSTSNQRVSSLLLLDLPGFCSHCDIIKLFP